MVKRCVSGFCSNTNKDDVSLYLFPKDPFARKQWSDFVRLTREDWQGPTEYSVLCSAHFSADSFEYSPLCMVSLGLEVRQKRKLKPGAIPTLTNRPKRTSSTTTTTTTELSTRKKVRGAFEKRERKREVEAILRTAHGSGSESKGMSNDLSQDTLPPSLDSFDDHSTEDLETNQDVQLHSSVTHSSCQANLKPYRRSKSTQTPLPTEAPGKVEMVSVAVQWEPQEEPQDPAEETPVQPTVIPDEDEETEEPLITDPPPSPDYRPSDSSDSDSDLSDMEWDTQQNIPLHSEEKFIVFRSSLLKLLKMLKCPSCNLPEQHWRFTTVGTLLSLTGICSVCSEITSWTSQPYVGDLPAGNILLSAAILFTGGLAGKMLRVLSHLGVACISPRTFFRHQESVLLPAIEKVWLSSQAEMINRLRGEKRALVLGGDGRADSPGHCAKYGSYTTMELEANNVLDIQLVQSNECGGSYHMEKEGLKRSVQFLQEKSLEIGTLITDRHRQIAKWIRENLPNTKHRYDIWHVAKSFAKKMKSCKNEELKLWTRSVVNHMYWSAVSTEDDGDLVVEKWVSVVNHLMDIHSGHGDRFHNCLHGPLDTLQEDGTVKAWIKPHTEAAVKLEKLVMNRVLVKDIAKLSCGHQTSSTEAFHSLIIHFAPKMTVFTYPVMLARLQLTALHYNENSIRHLAYTKEGLQRHKITFPKSKHGDHTVRPIKENPTFGYIHVLMGEALKISQTKLADRNLERRPVPRPLADEFVRPSKNDAVQQHQSRFSR